MSKHQAGPGSSRKEKTKQCEILLLKQVVNALGFLREVSKAKDRALWTGMQHVTSEAFSILLRMFINSHILSPPAKLFST